MTKGKDLKPVTIRNDETNETYVLTFTRRSVMNAEENGFGVNDLQDFENKPLTTFNKLIFFALQANHKGITKDKANEIANDWLGGVAGCDPKLIEQLAGLYIASYETLKNPHVTVTL